MMHKLARSMPAMERTDGTRLIFETTQSSPLAMIAGGPSFANVDKEALRTSGLSTLALNNAILSYRSDMWLGVDGPHRFVRDLWTDAAVQKFTPRRHRLKSIAGEPKRVVRDCPNVILYRQDAQLITEEIFGCNDPLIWDNQRGHGARASFMDALRLAYAVGFRRIYLFGVDFWQEPGHVYHYPKVGVRNRMAFNNQLYHFMQIRLSRLRPYMENAGLKVFNCNPTSRLTAFDYCDPTAAFESVDSDGKL